MQDAISGDGVTPGRQALRSITHVLHSDAKAVATQSAACRSPPAGGGNLAMGHQASAWTAFEATLLEGSRLLTSLHAITLTHKATPSSLEH